MTSLWSRSDGFNIHMSWIHTHTHPDDKRTHLRGIINVNMSLTSTVECQGQNDECIRHLIYCLRVENILAEKCDVLPPS